MTNDSLFENVDGDWLRLQVKSDDEGKFEQRIARLQRVKLHKIIPHLWFDLASTECRDLFRDGHYYGCICLSQSVAEGIAKFVLEVHREKVGKQQRPIESCRKPMTGRQLIARLKKLKGGTRNDMPISVLSQRCIEAFERIEGRDRDDFHHLNKDVAMDREKLEKRAEECLSDLYDIESDLFGFGIENGAVTPFKPQYWPLPNADGLTRVFLRSY